MSGKGGTGKTSLSAAFAHLAHEGPSSLQVVLADADVDAANLELVLQPRRLEEHDFYGGAVAVIDESLCEACGICEQACRFEAILPRAGGEGYSVDPIACDGCAACVYQCPSDAIHMQDQLAGRWFHSQSRYGPLLHAELRPAQENSGKLVTLVKQRARLLGLESGADLVIVDGPPGIGCPVISAAAGADLALIVTEPTAAGIHDMARMLEMTAHFRLPALVCINKADIYPQGSAQIESYCRAQDIQVIGHIPFDLSVTEAMVQAEPVTACMPVAPASQAIEQVWQVVLQRLSLIEKNERH
ncbi:MAG: ATP-binding protein [Anaerolineales bacterium]